MPAATLSDAPVSKVAETDDRSAGRIPGGIALTWRLRIRSPGADGLDMRECSRVNDRLCGDDRADARFVQQFGDKRAYVLDDLALELVGLTVVASIGRASAARARSPARQVCATLNRGSGRNVGSAV